MGQWSWSHLEKTSRGGWSINSTRENNGGVAPSMNTAVFLQYAHTQTQVRKGLKTGCRDETLILNKVASASLRFVQGPLTSCLALCPSFPSFGNKVLTPAHTVSSAWKLSSHMKHKYEL